MELIIKASAAALTAAAAGLLIKKSNPELSLLLTACVSAIITASALGFARGIRELSEIVTGFAAECSIFIKPVLKCLGVSVISKMSAELCRDSSQSAAASALEFAGSICAMSIALPLIINVLNLIGGFI